MNPADKVVKVVTDPEVIKSTGLAVMWERAKTMSTARGRRRGYDSLERFRRMVIS